MTKRILVTGSRDWTHHEELTLALESVFEALGGGPDTVLVSGACPTGADAIAEDHWATHNRPVERHPADWSQGRSAGPARNTEMVALGADVCVAFIGPCTSPRCHLDGVHASHGASGCADMAKRAGIDVIRFLAPELEPEETTEAEQPHDGAR